MTERSAARLRRSGRLMLGPLHLRKSTSGVVVLAIVGVLLLAACGGTSHGQSTGKARASTTTTVSPQAQIPTTPIEQNAANATVVLPLRHVKGQPDSRLQLGPAQLTSRGVSTAKASYNTNDGWGVDLTLTSSGLAAFNAMAAGQYGKPSPTDEVAIELDGVVQANPRFNTAHFDNNSVRVSGQFTQTEASDLTRTIIELAATTPPTDARGRTRELRLRPVLAILPPYGVP